MKRFLCALFCLVLLCGCSGSSKTVTPVLSGISFTAKVSFYNEYYECETVIDTDGAMRISVLSPADISGMRLIFSNDSVTAEYMGLTYTHKNLYIYGGINFPFWKYRNGSERVSKIAPVTLWNYIKDAERQVNFTLRYRFEFGKAFKERNRNAGYSDKDSGIM